MPSRSIDRYRSLVPEWDRFLEAVATPEPTFVRVRAGRTDPGEVVGRLEARGFRLRPVSGLDRVYRVDEEPFPVADTLGHWDGLLYIQQAVTATAAPALGARPGEAVLDMAAALGGKTTHLADLMEDRGALVAGDRSEKRMQALMANIYRTAHPGVAVVSGDGRSLPGEDLFDRVLLDAPCSGEGNLRGRDGLPGQSKRFLARIVDVQAALLRRAVELARPGGVILYSTCTFNPEENEGVVDRVLAEGAVEVERIPLELPHAPGVTAWEGARYAPALERAWRLYPHHLDSGGFFMVRLRKRGDRDGNDRGGWEPVARGYGPGDREVAAERIPGALALLEEEYGVDREVLEGLSWMVRGDSIWATTADRWAPSLWRSSRRHRLVAIGLRATKIDGRIGRDRPTNDFLTWLGGRITKRIVEVDRERLERLLGGERIGVETDRHGFVVVRFRGRVLGRALARDGVLVHHEIPRARAERLGAVLDAVEGAAPGR